MNCKKILFTNNFIYSFFLLISLPSAIFCQKPSLEFIAIWDILTDENTNRDIAAIAVDPVGHLYLTDVQNQMILKYTAQGKLIHQTGGFGWNEDQFDQPVGISASNGLDVFVADYMNHRIVRYDNKLNFISTFASDESRDHSLQFGYPKDVQISRQGELFLIDAENQRILKFDVLGQPQLSFGDYDDHDGNLIQPEKFKLHDDLIYVTDSHLAKVFIFDIHGNFLSTFTTSQMQKPSGLVMYREQLFVADSGADCIWVFSKRGEMLFKFGPLLSRGIKLENPVDLDIIHSRLYVVERGKSQLLVFKLSGF